MALVPGLYTISGLQAELGITARKLGEVLATVPAEGGTSQRPTWRIKTVLAALAKEQGEGLNPAAEKARLDKARADIAEIELEKRRGDVASLLVVAQTWADFCINVKTRLRSIPTKAAPLLAAESRAEDCKDILNKFIDEALTELAESPIYGQEEGSGDAEDGGDEPEAAAEADRQPVGRRKQKAVV